MLRGRVLDAAGAPVASAAISLAARATWTTADPAKSPAAMTGADGRFVLPVPEPEEGRPAHACFLVAPKLASGEIVLPRWSEAEVDCGDLQLVDGTTLAGRVHAHGGRPVVGARVEVSDLLPGSGRVVFLSAAMTSAGGAFALPCALPEAARLTVTAPGHYTATPRSGPAMDVPIGKVLLEQADRKREFDMAGDRRGLLRGKVAVTGTLPPRGRLVVRAVPQPRGNAVNPFAQVPTAGSGLERRALLAADGSFALELASGGHTIEVLDLLTGMVLHRDAEVTQVAAGAATVRGLTAALVPLRVSFTPGSYVAASLSVALDPGDLQRSRQGDGLQSLAESPREVTLFVPPGDLELTVNAGASGGGGPLGEAEVTARAGELAQVTVRVAPGPAPTIEDQPGATK